MTDASETLERLALQYRKGDEAALAGLFELIKKPVRRMIAGAVRRARNCGLAIPAEDFESVFGQAVWEACKDYDGTGYFCRFLRIYLKRAEADVWRKYRNVDNGKVAYTDASMLSLDAIMELHGDANSDAGIFRSPDPGPEDDVSSESAIVQALEEFSEQDASNGRIVKLLAAGLSGYRLRRALWPDKCASTGRVLIHKARKAFKRFLLLHYKDDFPGLFEEK